MLPTLKEIGRRNLGAAADMLALLDVAHTPSRGEGTEDREDGSASERQTIPREGCWCVMTRGQGPTEAPSCVSLIRPTSCVTDEGVDFGKF